MTKGINPNLTILESIFFGRGSVPKGFKLQQKKNDVATQLPLTQEGLIQSSKKPYFKVELGTTLIDSARGLTPDNYAEVLQIRSVSQRGEVFDNVDDGIDVLPDAFIDPLGVLNDQIDSNGERAFDDLSLIVPKEKKILTLKDLRGSGLPIVDIADRFDLTLEELVEHVNKNGISLEDLAHIIS